MGPFQIWLGMTVKVVKATGGGKFIWRKFGGSSEMADADRRERESVRDFVLLLLEAWRRDDRLAKQKSRESESDVRLNWSIRV